MAAVQILFACVASAAPFNPLHLVSVRDVSQAPPAGGSGDAWGPILSADGRFVAFASTANNLVAVPDQDLPGLNSSVRRRGGDLDGPAGKRDGLPVLNQPRLNVFLRDRLKGTTRLVSVNLQGTGGGNGDSRPTAVSADGRYVCFESEASDLVEGDTNRVSDIFLRDMAAKSTVLISASVDAGVGNGVSRNSTMTPSGRYVAFVSAATNLVPGDTNGIADVFVRDLETGSTTLVSVGATATTNFYSRWFGSSGSEGPDITPDGRYVAFFSTAGNLLPGVSSPGEVYVRDLVAQTTTWVSSGARALLGLSNAVSYNQALSADGRFVAYQTSTNAGISVIPSSGGLVLRYDLKTGLTKLVSTNANVQAADYKDVRSLEMTPDGRFIAFVANTNHAGSWAGTCIELWDGYSGKTLLVSGGYSNALPPGATCHWPVLDHTGRYVAFLSNATNLVGNSLLGEFHAYVRDTQSGTTTLIDADTNGIGSSLSPSTAPQISADGQVSAFESPDANLVPDDRNHAYDVFVRDLSANAVELISARHAALASATPNGLSSLNSSCVSSNGQLIVFASEADNLVANDTNGVRDIFVRDLLLGTTRLVSAATNGAPGDNISSQPALSGDGRYVVFTSSADNLVAGDTNNAQDIFLRDLQTDTTWLVSVNFARTGPGNTNSYSPGISSDGTHVWFRSGARNLTSGTFAGLENLFLLDLPTSIMHALTTLGVLAVAATPDGHFIAYTGQNGNLYIWDSDLARVVYSQQTPPVAAIGISPDGNRFVYSTTNGLTAVDRAVGWSSVIGGLVSGSRAGLRFSSDGRVLTYAALLHNTNQVYSYDFETGSNVVISHNAEGSVGNDASDSPDVSPDARFIAYRTFATNLLPPTNNTGLPQLLLYDRTTGSTGRLTESLLGGGVPDNRSRTPVFSPDGRALVFESWASDLLARDFNQSADIFVLNFLYLTIAPEADGHRPILTWPARPGERYRLEFKVDLNEPEWRQVNGAISIQGNRAQVSDLDATAQQRFYRVVAFQ